MYWSGESRYEHELTIVACSIEDGKKDHVRVHKAIIQNCALHTDFIHTYSQLELIYNLFKMSTFCNEDDDDDDDTSTCTQ